MLPPQRLKPLEVVIGLPSRHSDPVGSAAQGPIADGLVKEL